jgi:predicted permease
VNEFWVVLGAVLPVFCVVGAGAALRRLDWLTEEADASLLRLVINVFSPCLILTTILGSAALRNIGNLLVAPLVGFGTVAGGILLAWSCRRFAGLRNTHEQRTFAVSTGIYNYGYVPIPLAILLYGEDTLGVLFVHNVGVEIGLWTVGLLFLTGAPLGREWHKAINPPLVAIVIGLIVNLLGGSKWIPGFVFATIKMLGQCAIPLGILLIGTTIADKFHEFHSKSAWRLIGTANLLRLVVLPVGFVVMARFLPVSVELKRVILLQAAMPAAVFPIVMARHYGGDTATALRVVITSSAASLVTTPLWIRLGAYWIGL